MMAKQYEIAYFSAEIGISSSLPTYSGGLGVLAGDHIKAAGDIGLNMCAVTLLYREGYFKQRIDEVQNVIDSDVYQDINKFYYYSDFSDNVNTTTSGIIGLNELMDARTNFLQNNSYGEMEL